MSSAQRLVLVLNAGSSSIKYQLFDMPQTAGTLPESGSHSGPRTLAKGLLDRVGQADARLNYQRRLADGSWVDGLIAESAANHAAGLALVARALGECPALADGQALYAVGHRVVHGGERFQAPTRITAEVVAGIRATIPLAPLHNPANLLGIEVSLEHLADIPQVAVFDTAFHHSLPPHAYRYALPERLYLEHGVRRYGFHGTSHAYVARQAAAMLGRPLSALKLVTLHLGNGASVTAIDGGRSIDTSMGMTPLEGLVMGTRSGDLDPAIVLYLAREIGMDLDAVDVLLNKESGLAGIAGSGDMREILARKAAGDIDAALAFELFCYRIRKYIGAYIAVLGRVDAIVFTGGIGEHASEVRERVCSGLEGLGLRLDEGRNVSNERGGYAIQQTSAAVALLVIPTNEELEIALQTVAAVEAAG